MPSIMGPTLAKVNGIYRLDVTNATWDVKQPIRAESSGAGRQLAVSNIYEISGGFDEVVPTQGIFNWQALSDFTIQIYDQATQKILVFACSGAEWGGIGGGSNVGQAKTDRKIPWQARLLVKV